MPQNDSLGEAAAPHYVARRLKEVCQSEGVELPDQLRAYISKRQNRVHTRES